MTSFKQIHCEYVNGDDKKRQKFGFEEEPEVVDREEAPTSSSCEKKKKEKSCFVSGASVDFHLWSDPNLRKPLHTSQIFRPKPTWC